MLKAVFLYGSRSRNDAEQFSDTDLLGVANGGRIEKLSENGNVSFHIYPHDWMVQNAEDGSLFLLHIVSEATALYDPGQTLEDLKRRFRWKSSYLAQVETGIRIVAATIAMTRQNFDDKARARYFWGMRTAIMAASANEGKPIFSSLLLERYSRIDGLEHHIKSRSASTFEECCRFGEQVVTKLNLLSLKTLLDDPLENLRVLANSGGVGAATAGSIMYG